VVTKLAKGRVPFTDLRNDEWLLRRDLLDQQIVDTEGKRVMRVNDLKLALVENEVRLIAADVGLRGLVRRLRILRPVEAVLALWHKTVPETLLGWDHVEQLKTTRVGGAITIPKKHLSELHPADIASIISQVHPEARTALFDSLSEKTAAEALHELEPKIQALLLQTIDTKRALGIIEKMPVDEVADVLGDVPEERAEEFLRLMRVKKAVEVKKLLAHNEETAGGIMTTEFITIPQALTVQATIDRMRELAPDAETIYYLYIVDDDNKLVGVLSLRNLIVSAPETLVKDIMIKEPITISPEMNQRKAAETISKYNLLAVPVVDKEMMLLGIITVDDVMDFVLPPISRRKREMLG
jgi:Mg/Co/Ni transporter MgtE